MGNESRELGGQKDRRKRRDRGLTKPSVTKETGSTGKGPGEPYEVPSKTGRTSYVHA